MIGGRAAPVDSGIRLGDLAGRLGAELHGDPQIPIHRVGTLAGAGEGALTFLANRRYADLLAGTRASAVILEREFLARCPVAALVSDRPYLAYARAAGLLVPSSPAPGGVHPRAWVEPSARVHPSAWIGPMAVIEADAEIGARTEVGPGCVVGRGAKVAEDGRLVAQVTLCHGVRVGARALLHPGVVVGGDGFGIARDAQRWEKVPQLGGVWIGDDVEIGANTTVDRGAIEDTVIEDGVKLDNLIQIGHNVRIGAHTAVAACVAIGGSARIGRHCTIAGAASIAGHLEIADGVHLTATSAVPASIAEPGTYSSGMPVMENRAWRRMIGRMRQLDDMARRLRALERSR
jgi:UDP-3-O-[3-hydroxymyristoyl] glucosamine N-acyltransferase